jgi:signal transduction histidine kinase
MNNNQIGMETSLPTQSNQGSIHEYGQAEMPGAAFIHEIRNPLTNINLAVGELLLTLDKVNQRSFLNIIMRASMRISSIINTLDNCQKTGSGNTELASMHQVLDEVLQLTQDQLGLRNIAVEKKYGVVDYKGNLNWYTVKIALTNIVINAIDAMEPGKGILKLSSNAMDGKYIVHLEDNGCGISATNLEHIFQPYFTRKPGGLGIGLATAYAILKSNNIGVEVESQEGKGTTFKLSVEHPV